jgi:TRAP-type C4-dicarboxylate transport system permease large subunit
LATQGEEALRSPAQAEAAIRGLNELLAVLNTRLAKQAWMLGADYSLVDLVVGSVLDGLAMMLLTTPILLPLVADLGLSPIWFGIFLVRAMEIGFVHPPIGMNLYVIQGVAPDVPLSRIFKGVLPFLAADLLHLVLLVLFPVLVLGLPQWLGQ